MSDRYKSNMNRPEDCEATEPTSTLAKPLSRRDFLKIAGIAGATVGMGAGLGGLVAACGGTTTTTAAATTAATAGATTSSSEGGPTTLATSGVEGGRDIKVGVVAPLTGIYAVFSPSAKWQIERWNEALKDGVVAGDGKNHKMVLVLTDTQSDSNRASQVTADLIHNDKVDVVLSAGTSDTVNPSADQCESLGVPSVSSFVPWQNFVLQRGHTPDQPFKWTYGQTLGIEQLLATYLDILGQVPTNKKLAGLFANDSIGLAFTNPKTGQIPGFIAAGYTPTVPSLYTPGAEDFTQQISMFKKAGCEVCTGQVSTSDFVNFWNAAAQQGFHPKAMVIGLALLFPESATAVGPNVVGCTSELVWHPSWPFKSSLTGETCQQLADDYETRTSNQWSPALAQYARMEWVVDAIKRTANVDDKEALIKAISTTKLDTMNGSLDFTVPVKLGTTRPTENCYMAPLAGGQWIKGTGKWPYEIIEVSNVTAPGTQPQAKAQPMQYAS